MRRGAPGAAPLLLLGLALGLPAAPARALEPSPGVARVVAFADGEGTCRRWTERLSPASPCAAAAYRPTTSLRHAAPECGGTECDHCLDIAITANTVSVRARFIDHLPTGATMETVTWARAR